jgi:HD domain
MFKKQRIRDPVHNLIEFRAEEFENSLWRALETRPFQRLRRVKQLGFSDFVYPGAGHSRFAHSIGVFHTARQLMKVINDHLGQHFELSKARVALAAALVHDLGHGPFSHAFEDVGRRLGLKMADHEHVSDLLIRQSEVSEALRPLGSGFANDVADLIKSSGPGNMYSAVVSSQFDADRLDYSSAEKIFSELLQRVIRLTVDDSSTQTGLLENHPLVRFGREPDKIGSILALDDTVVWGSLSQMAGASDNVVSELAGRLRDRRLYKCVDVRARLGHLLGKDGSGLSRIEQACASIIMKK